jgi:4-aminobutyrate aminotransferase-like enzyme
VCEERLWELADFLGKRLLDGLRNLSEHRYFWDARGRGLLVGLEIVADQRTGEVFADPVAAGNRLRIRCRELGLAALILHPGNVLFLAPPLVISEQEVDRMVAIVEEALTDMEDGRA